MTRSEIITRFREENPDITNRVITNAVLQSWTEIGDKNVCARARCIVDQDGTAWTPAEDDQYYDLTDKISKFYDIDEYPGAGVLYNDKRLEKTTMAELHMNASKWRTRDAGTPVKYYRRGKYLYLDRPIDSNVYEVRVFAVLISDDFDDDDKTPYNQLSYLEPFHPILVRYLKWRAKEKVGKPQDAGTARAEYILAIEDMKKLLGGGKFGKIYLRKAIH